MNYKIFSLFILITSSVTLAQEKSYTETEISIPTNSVTINGNLITALSFEKHPLVILIPGSGPTDRDGNSAMTKNNSLKYLAEALANEKIATYRFDKSVLSYTKVDKEKVFDWMKRDLKVGNNYTIHSFVRPVEKDSDFLIKSEKYGVPQMRHRVILLGVRKDYKHTGDYLKEKKEVSLKSIIGNLPAVRSGLNRKFIGYHISEVSKNGGHKRLYQNLNFS